MQPEALTPDSPLVVQAIASPNHGERRGVARPDCVILHYTGTPTCEGAVSILCDPDSELSSHYVIDEAGGIIQLVPESRRAWHAGVSVWKGLRDINSASIGIEICNAGHAGGLPEFPEAQVEATVALCLDIAVRRSIRPERFLAHSDVAPGRKRDPGERFPWRRLARAGVGHWIEPAEIAALASFARGQEGPPVRALQTLLSLYGYGVEATGVYDAQTETVVAAFQRHFRPARVDGAADASTMATLRGLLEALNPGGRARS